MVRDLALGRLDDQSALRAEETLSTCPTCSRWWEVTLEGGAAAEVDTAVASAIASFRPPAAIHRFRTAFLAAAAMLLIGLGISTVTRHTPTPVPNATDEIVASVETTTGTLVAALDFESGSVDAHASVEVVSRPAAPPAPKPAAKEAVVNAVSMETGDLSGWSSHS